MRFEAAEYKEGAKAAWQLSERYAADDGELSRALSQSLKTAQLGEVAARLSESARNRVAPLTAGTTAINLGEPDAAGFPEYAKIGGHLIGTPAIVASTPGISQTELARLLGCERATAGLQVAEVREIIARHEEEFLAPPSLTERQELRRILAQLIS